MRGGGGSFGLQQWEHHFDVATEELQRAEGALAAAHCQLVERQAEVVGIAEEAARCAREYGRVRAELTEAQMALDEVGLNLEDAVACKNHTKP
jgi:chromosome segregation ATPase